MTGIGARVADESVRKARIAGPEHPGTGGGRPSGAGTPTAGRRAGSVLWRLSGIVALTLCCIADAPVLGVESAAVDSAPEPGAAAEALRRLGEELAERAKALERRETELEEALRGAEVLLRARQHYAGELAGSRDEMRTGEEIFLRLRRTFENMEAPQAARALQALAGKDREMVVQLLLGWPPRTAGAVLGAITRDDAALAAELSYEIWKRSGLAR